VRELLATLSVRVAYVHCGECFWNRSLLYERIIQQLRMPVAQARALNPHPNFADGLPTLPEQRAGYRNSESCRSMTEFVETLKSIFPPGSTQETLEVPYILLDSIEKLDVKVFGETFLPCILRLSELVRESYASLQHPHIRLN
jgi:hypothetical protein